MFQVFWVSPSKHVSAGLMMRTARVVLFTHALIFFVAAPAPIAVRPAIANASTSRTAPACAFRDRMNPNLFDTGTSFARGPCVFYVGEDGYPEWATEGDGTKVQVTDP